MNRNPTHPTSADGETRAPMKRLGLWMSCLVWILFGAGIGHAQLQSPGANIRVEKGGTTIEVPRLKSDRLEYRERPGSVRFSIQNIAKERPGKPWSLYSQEGFIDIWADGDSVDEHAAHTVGTYGKNYDKVNVIELDGGARLIVMEEFSGRDLASRRCVLWWQAGKTTISLNAIFSDDSSSRGRKEGRQLFADILAGIRVNGDQPIPAYDRLMSILQEK